MSRWRYTTLVCALSLAVPVIAFADQPLTVRAVEARQTLPRHELTLTGVIEAAQSLPVSFRSGGRVTEIAVSVGDRVAQGALLASVDPTQAMAAAGAAAAQLSASDAALTRAMLAADRAASLLERGAGTTADLDAAKEALLSAQSTRDQAAAQLAKAEQAIRDTNILAPVSGVITERLVEPGQVVGAAQTVVTLAADGQREAVFYAPDFHNLSDFLRLRLTLTSLDSPQTTYIAVISDISPLANERTGTVEVRAEVLDTDAPPRLGSAVTSTVSLTVAQAYVLPASAFVVGETGPAVWIIDPQTQRVHLQGIDIAGFTTNEIEVSDGLSEGQLVVTDGAHLMYPDRLVTIDGAQK